MAEIFGSAAATLSLLSTLLMFIDKVTGDLKRDCQRLECHVRSMNEYYERHKDDPSYYVRRLGKALLTETRLVNAIRDRLKKEMQTEFWQFADHTNLKDYLNKSERELRQSTQTMNNLLKHIGTGALIPIANQQNDPIPQADEADEPQASTPIKEAPPASAAEYYGTQPANEDLPLNKADKVQEWLANFAIESGIYIPNKHEMLLPFDFKPQVYKRMKTDLGSEGPMEEFFYEVLKRKFPRYKVYDERKDIKATIKNHHPMLGHTTVTITTLVPRDVNLPQLVPRDDRTVNLAKLNVHLTGGLFEDGSEPKPHIFRDLNHVPHDTNFIINCLLNLLVHHKGELKKSLLLQLYWDQSEMKKNILLSFVFLLVDLNIFEEIYVRFLPQTPIIAAVRRIFPHINQQLSERNIPYIDDLDRTIEGSCSTKVRAEEMKYVYDVEGWMSSHLAEWPADADNHMWFRFCKRDGTTFMYSKSSLDDPWPDTAGFTHSIPATTSVPGWVRPSLSTAVDVDALEKDIPDKYSSKISSKKGEDWKKFMSLLRSSYDQVPRLPEPWPLQDLMTGKE